MGTIVVKNQPCLSKECGSHDARQIYDNGTSFCFSCRTWFPKEDGESMASVKASKIEIKSQLPTLEEIKSYPIRGFADRDIGLNICEFYDVRVSYNSEREIDTHYYPYDEACVKVRKLPKSFFLVGKSHKLFGQTKFNAGGKRLVITEGEIDAMSVAQAYYDKYQKVYPAVAIPSASHTKVLLENRDWIRSFNEVVLCFDEDKAGKEALDEAIKIVGIDKARIAHLPCKDPDLVYRTHGGNKLLQAIWDAEKFVPSGIIGKEELWKALESYNNIPALPYPPCLDGVNGKLKGKRLGEITLFISGTGSGKSTILREDILYTLENAPPEDKVGIISLEESPAETARKLSGMVLHKNPANEEIPLEQLKKGFDVVFGSDRVVLLDHQGSIDDNRILDQLEYMCLSGCKYIYIDHITILVSEGMENLSGNEAQDKVMNDLLRLVKRYPVWIGLVSHLRKSNTGAKSFEEGRLPSIDDIRGSGSIKQISFDIISFARDLTATDDLKRNTILMRILKARYTGLTGNVRGSVYDYKTGRLSAAEETAQEDFTTL